MSETAEGWLCPRCGKVNAPWKAQCSCATQSSTFIWTLHSFGWSCSNCGAFTLWDQSHVCPMNGWGVTYTATATN